VRSSARFEPGLVRSGQPKIEPRQAPERAARIRVVRIAARPSRLACGRPPRDVVLIARKGHEDYRSSQGQAPFDTGRGRSCAADFRVSGRASPLDKLPGDRRADSRRPAALRAPSPSARSPSPQGFFVALAWRELRRQRPSSARRPGRRRGVLVPRTRWVKVRRRRRASPSSPYSGHRPGAGRWRRHGGTPPT